MIRAAFAMLSLLINRALGGRPGEYLCTRIARRFGHRCLFCRVVGLLSCEPHHCDDQMTARDIFERLKRK